MTSRERWTVYPLLFLAIGMGLRNRPLDVMNFKAVQCESLKVLGSEGKAAVVLGSTKDHQGLLELTDANGLPIAVLGPAAKGGNLRLITRDQKTWVNLGFEEPQPGVIIAEPNRSLIHFPVMRSAKLIPATDKKPKESKPQPANPTPEETPNAPEAPSEQADAAADNSGK